MHFQPVEASDEDAYLPHGGGGGLEAAAASRAAHDELLDDVFGSESPSPSTRHQDLWGAAHPSDMHRLETEHATAGYREGITASKESSMQAGFDEGFSLGAAIGLQVGQLLGTLEAVSDALKGETGDAATMAGSRLETAREELATGRIFSTDYWAPDGNWTYKVEGGEGDDVLFSDVAKAHPLLRKWNDIVDEQIKQWKIDPTILHEENAVRLTSTEDGPLISSTPLSSNKPLDW
ncbi:Essential protein Yae1, N terminal [Purpureocillium takamizusanense]|uniref:Protein YAE1 n=1 Tax=Purpureocillium takamizusanense TaxID=2060973 RepID=A0A9Q8VGA5_9HYPO|nr:Essential protein Yae1, N terminal [Purpureocillium takamizusanense]UNI24321.1 Essential protein Yae1, N terminal [Purpureocillium takamizusanense]